THPYPLIPCLISHQVSLISQLKSGEAWGGPADFDDKRWAPGVAPPNLRAELTLWPHASPRSGAIAAALMGERRGSKSQRNELRGSKSRPASRRNEAVVLQHLVQVVAAMALVLSSTLIGFDISVIRC
ncbi:unnamed protein product, partial [Urochloa humidicola]